MKSLLGMCNGIVHSDVGTGDSLLVQGILHMRGHMHVRLLVTQGMDCILCYFHFLFSTDGCF